MRLRVIDQGEDTPLASHAVPYGIAAAMAAEDEPVLTLSTAATPYVSIGASQDFEREIDAACPIPVLRREVGGGVVLIDRDQLYFHVVFPHSLVPVGSDRLFAHVAAPVVATYAGLGIAAAYAAQEIQADGRKLGAMAAAEIGEAMVVAGSFLFDFDRALFARSLRLEKEMDRSMLRQNLAARIATMRDLLSLLPARRQVRDLFVRHAAEAFGCSPAETGLRSPESAAVAEASIRHADPGWIRWREGRRGGERRGHIIENQ
ncbi:MAG: lipoate--protein ligase family protein [Rhodospirillaceae bacterium]|nr:lipoate--protein ligase family protein [Rhodospirillaceae bacterium]